MERCRSVSLPSRGSRLPTLLLCILLLAATLAGAQPEESVLSDTPKEAETATTLGYGDALILGIVEGITEYLPISSTGHLVLTNALLGLDKDIPLADIDGGPPADTAGAPYTLRQAANAYAIVIQFGAILAVAVLYWPRIWSILLGFIGRDPGGRRLGINLILAFLPAVALGLLLDGWITSLLFAPIPIAVALAAGAVLMLLVERRRSFDPEAPEEGPDLTELSARQCLIIGLLQCVAMWPGTSRSMMTLVGGYLVGLSPRRAAEFSFLLGLITLSSAAFYRVATDGPRMVGALAPGPVLFGVFMAFLSAVLAVKWLVAYLTRHGLALFAWYRLVLAVLVVVFLVGY